MIGGKTGALIRGTILKYNGDGTIDVAIDRSPGTTSTGKYTVPIPLPFSGPNGEFIGGYPSRGSSVILSQGQGEWFASSYINSNNVFKGSLSAGVSKNLMAELKPDRILFQTKNASNRLFLDPNDGIHFGLASQEVHADPKRGLLSHNFKKEMSFTAAHRSIIGVVKRDLKENSTRNISGSILTSHEYEDSLFTIGMDPSTAVSTTTTSNLVRNLPLVENKEVVYEFQNLPDGIGFTTDSDEADRYISKQNPKKSKEILRTESRTNAFSLSLNYPNHLIETIKGTGVDIYGNILDINREILPIGKTDELSFTKNTDAQDAFKKIRAQHRNALAYHFEINSRKGNDEIAQVPDVNSKNNYGKDRSRFFIDINKEGVFKLNVSASSETGSVPLLTRYENASTLLAAQGDIDNPNAFLRESNNQDIFHENFANYPSISLNKSSVLIDRFENEPIKLGTAYHDIAKTALQHQNTGRQNLINYFTKNQTYLNNIDYVENIVSDLITLEGPNANAGGRSGLINLDGHISVNVGANTIDRQSAWFDFAGGIISNIGRDKFGRSYVATYDGDIIIQVGSTGVVGDSRFENENNAHRAGTFDIRVVDGTGQLAVIRIDKQGIFISSPGRLEVNSQQDMTFRSNSNIKFEGKQVIFYPDNGQSRIVKRNGVPEI